MPFKEFSQLIVQFVSDTDGENKDCIDNYLDKINFKHLYDTYYNTDDDDIDITEMIDESWDDFVNETFNEWENGDYNFYYWLTEIRCENIDSIIPTSNLLVLLRDATTWFKEELEITLDVTKSIETIINTLAYWAIRELDYCILPLKSYFNLEYLKRFDVLKIIEEYSESTETKLSCVICLEKKNIYTGCSCCNSAFVCAECYFKLENSCPLCRCPQMILSIRDCRITDDDDTSDIAECKSVWLQKLVAVSQQIKTK
jgi:hypothetical protein